MAFSLFKLTVLVVAVGFVLADDDLPILTKQQQQFLSNYQEQIDNAPASKSYGADESEPKCPEKEAIAPCSCSCKNGNINIVCLGGNVTQSSLENAISSTRSANSLTSLDTLRVYSYSVYVTNLTTVDLSFLQNVDLELLYFVINPNLTTVTGNQVKSDAPTAGTIDVTTAYFFWNPITDSGFGSSLSLFSKKLTNFGIGFGAIEGLTSSTQLLERCDQFPNLQSIYLAGNTLTEVSGGVFKRCQSSLRQLILGFNNIREVGQDAFALPQSQNSKLNLTIDLSITNVTNESFDNIEQTGLTSISRPTILNLALTPVEFLSQQNFEPFLLNNRENKINLAYANLTCDSRMSWLKQKRAVYEKQVLNTRCGNDRGRSVFKSTKT